MRFLNSIRLFFISLLLLFPALKLLSQAKGIVVDSATHRPIPFVNIHTKNADKVLGAMTDEAGHFTLNFSFRSLVFSHINYSTVEIAKKQLSDTVYLSPNGVRLTEIVVSNKQPQWIGDVLNEVIKQKPIHYQTLELQLPYDYVTNTLTDSSGYAFHSKGVLRVPLLAGGANYSINPTENIIHYKDKQAGPDFSNLKRMVYNNFIKDFDKGFVKKYSFTENREFTDSDKNRVQLMFKSRHYDDDKGYIVVDTLNKVILEFERKSGTEYNLKTQTSFVLRNAISTFTGFKYNEWFTQIHAKFEKFGNSYLLSECKYKFHMKSTKKTNKVNQTYFSSIESQLSVNTDREVDNTTWITLPKPYYLITFLTKKMQQEEKVLNQVPVIFEIY